MDEEIVFSASEESDAGGSSYCWVAREEDGYVLYGNELGQMTDPCETVVGALNESGFEFGMDYIKIETTVSPEALQEILESPAFQGWNTSHLLVNGAEADPDNIEGVVAAYRESGRGS